MKLAIVAVIFLSALGVLVWMGVVEGKIPVYKIQEMKAKASPGQVCRIDDGVIKSIERLGIPLEFTITSDADPSLALTVHSKILPPDNFKVGYKVGVKGSFDPASGVFQADEVMTKCPSRYKASETAAAGPPAAKMP